MNIGVAATFTAEPLRDSLAFWSEKLQWRAEVEFAPYNQVFQQLLDPASVLSKNLSGVNVVLVRPEDWLLSAGDDSDKKSDVRPGLLRSAEEFVGAARSAVRRAAMPYFICLCPASPQNQTEVHISEAEALIAEQLGSYPGVHFLHSAEITSLYPVANYYDADRDELGHIPYTTEFFAALGTVLARKIYGVRQNPYKVIVSDCDETLWKGVCGELGPQGIEIDAGRRALQEFFVAQHSAGMLLCLCSKNVEEDIDEVFRCHTSMPLKAEHILARRINWQSKPQNLRELASELQLGLDSFIFIDDSPLECEQVRAACPQVLTLQLPAAEEIPNFLRNVWAFDKHKLTAEDRRRTGLYRENQERDRFRRQAPTLESFLAGLQLNVVIGPPAPEELPRVAQLTQRTNQFNCTSQRCTEEGLRHFLAAGQLECLAVQVRDRFGDYGLTGVVLYSATDEGLRVNTFLLSCRVLGRGVEHAVLRRLGAIASSRGIDCVDIDFIPSAKNAPALAFLESVAADFKTTSGHGYIFRVPALYAAGLSDSKVLASSQAAANAAESQDVQPSSKTAVAAPSEVMQEIAGKLGEVGSILQSIRKSMGFSEGADLNRVSPRNSREQAVVQAWTDVLGTAEIRPSDDFFSLGGDSLLATQVISRLRQVSGVRLHLGDLFNNPTLASFSLFLQKAKAAQELAVRRSRQDEKHISTSAGSRIPRRSDPKPALSFSQQRWWFLNQWAPGTADHLSLVLRLKGKLNHEALQRSLNYLVRRHEVLRTTYALVDGNPVQVISPSADLPLSHISLTQFVESQPEEEARRILEEQFRRPFDLSHDRIVRASLLEFADDDHALVLIMHHIASDGWSRGVLLRELEAAYRAYSLGQEPDIPALPVRYADFAVFQREQWAQGLLDEQLAYWKQTLAGAPPVLQLPTDRPRPSSPDLREAIYTRILPQEVLQQLHVVGQNEGTTLFITLLAAFQVLLYRYSAQPDVVVGSPVAGRHHPEVEGLIGCFINMLVFRSHVDATVSFREFLAQVRQVAVEAQNRQDVPFERLVEEVERGREMSRAPIFQVVFALENRLAVPQLPDLEVQLAEVETRSAFHDLSLFVAEQTDGLRLRFEYRADLFDAATIERMAGHFINLLVAITHDPSQRVGLLSLVGSDERHQLLHRWNETRHYAADTCVHVRFQEQVKRFPGSAALSFEGQTMTYAELNARSNQLARYLLRMGIGPDTLVGLCMERSPDLVVAIIAILKAGGAYLPLDPRYPKDRLAFMLEDAKPPVVITQYELKELLPDVNGHLITLDTEWPEIEHELADDFAGHARPDHLAYVIYTSGSTGQPKGCQITHANLARLFSATKEWFRFDERDVWTMFHSYAFDFSVWEVWGALIYGGKLVIVPYLVSRSPEEFYALLENEAVTVLNQTPSSFRQLSQIDEQAGSTARLALRYVIFGGEALEMQSLKSWFERHGDATPRLINMYGITETTVHVTYRPLSMKDTAGASVIGKPIPDLQLYILDSHLEPAPVGVPGEIYVGGAGVARGYLNRPELNRERFIRDIFGPADNRRLYKSGDQARRLPNGDIEYLGRIDQQVKIRGFRIELGEIESILTQHPAVREAVVMVNSDQGEKRLVAYLVAGNGQLPSSADLHSFLKDRVPEYMVPAAFVRLDEMPLTSNGKIDRIALPAVDFAACENRGDFVDPRTPLEQQVAQCWKEVLGLERVGMHDNFFEIGGHSLLATRVIILLRTKLGLTFSLRLLFENPTVAGMACALIEPLVEHLQEEEVTRVVSEIENLSNESARQLREAVMESASGSFQGEAVDGTQHLSQGGTELAVGKA
ncbi:MAG TPA: amino acid adenylation domain-containing protein [Terriglobales bacterium]